MKRKAVTRNQKNAYKYIKHYIKTQSIAPSQMEIASEINVTAGAVPKILRSLHKCGKIRYYKNQNRGIELVTDNCDINVIAEALRNIVMSNRH